ncbi:MAG: glycerol-3-phosphate 1-O-acyltransferase PlsY [Thermoanaerobaculales bacterium]|nr:glycerol-3-phosphate 1-O-acyltransferase PlsY [Thermoanaerobaculales bacterium]
MKFEVALVVFAYFLGSMPTAYLLVRLMTGKDVRATGSGNVGATNALRTAGWKVGAVVTVIDLLKGAIPVWLMYRFNPESGWVAAAMLAAVLGHCYPVWLKFKGGKGVATCFGAFLVIAPLSALAALGLWIVVLVISRWVALASMVASASFPLILKLIDRPDMVTLVSVSAAAVIIILRHSSNIRGILTGTEVKTSDDSWR